MHYVKDTNHLAELCSKLNKSKFLAIDTEFIREKTCLLYTSPSPRD